MKIASKGLILVLTPLAFEVVFVGVLGFMLNQSESRIVQENRARTVVSDLIRLREVVAEVSNEQSIQALQPKEQFDQVTANRLTPFRSAERNSQYAFTSLKAGLKDDTNALEELNQLERMFSQWLLMQRQAMIYDNEGNTGLYREAMLCSYELAKELVAAEVKMRKRFASRHSNEPLRRLEQARALNWILLGGLVTSLITALALSFYFSRNITRRLKQLTDNSVRLAQEKPLLPPVAGDDEIAGLDRVFHQMANSLTESSRRERAISSRLQTILESIPVGLAVMLPDGELELVNRSLADLTKISADTLETLNISMLFVDETEKVFEFIRNCKPGDSLELYLGRFGIESRIQAASFDSLDGQLYLIILEDITARKQAERFKRDMMSMVTHDLRSPLASILAVLGILNRGTYGQLTERGLARVEGAERSLNRLVRLIGDLLDSEKLDSGKLVIVPKRINAILAVQRAFESVRGMADEGGVTLLYGSSEEQEIFADEDRVIQVLVNILSNSVKFSPRDTQVDVSIIDHGTHAQVRVRDQAGGIPEDMVKTIFDPFVQVNRADGKQHKGSGLGLAICKSIVELHGGTMGVESTEGVGSTFFFTLPFDGQIASVEGGQS